MYKYLIDLFELLEKEFPYSTMKKDFKGHHGMCKTEDGKLMITIWSLDRCWTVILEEESELKDTEGLITFAKKMMMIELNKEAGL